MDDWRRIPRPMFSRLTLRKVLFNEIASKNRFKSATFVMLDVEFERLMEVRDLV